MIKKGESKKGKRSPRVPATRPGESKNTDNLMQRELANLRSLMENTPDSIWSIDTEYRLVSVNSVFKSYCRNAFSVTLERGMSMIDKIPGPLRLVWKARFDRALRGETHAAKDHFEYEGVHQLVETAFAPIVLSGAVVGVSCRSIDITERTHAAEALRGGEERLRSAEEHIHDGICITDEQGRIIHWNRAMQKISGFDAKETLGKTAWEMVPAVTEASERIEGFAEEIRTLLRTGAAPWTDRELQQEYRKPDGTRISVIVLIASIKTMSGFMLVATVRDVTERQRIMNALRLSEEKFSKAFHGSPDAVNINRLSDGVYLDINPGFTKITGYTREDVIGRSSLPDDLGIWVHPEDRERMVETLRRDGEATGIEAPFRLKDGSIGYGLMSAKVLEIDGEKCILSITRDIADRVHAEEEKRKLEEQLRHAQKMESIGRLAGGVAHDFNNLLAPIMGYAELLLNDAELQGERRTELEYILKAAERARDLTRQLLAFSRKQLLAIEPQDLRHAVSELEPLLRRTITESISVTIHLPADPLPVCIDTGQIGQVLMNLAVNAQDAMPDGGRITIEARETHLDEDYCAAYPEMKPGVYAMLSVSDTGQGMDSSVLEHLFEPFFTTKAKGKGTGLGLSTVYGIIKQHGGQISAYSEPAHGSTFKILLPAVEGGSQKQRIAAEANAEFLGKGETVLVIEDSEGVRELAAAMLARLDYRVVCADCPETALSLVETQGARPRVILTDVVMPGMNGRDLFRRLAALLPGLRVLYMSGYTENAIAHHGVLDENIDFLEKPFSLEALGRKLREALERNPEPR